MNCDTCKNWNLADKKHWSAAHQINAYGFAMCNDGPVRQYTSPSHSCKDHAMADAKVISKRIEWFKAARAEVVA